MEKEFFEKLDNFLDILSQCENPVIAYSGGVDSAFLAKAAQKIELKRATCLLLVSPLLTQEELDGARKTAEEIGLPLIEVASDEMSIAEFAENNPQRCYWCKKCRLEIISKWAKDNGYQYILDGSNADDLLDYRPGMKALEDFTNVKSPLLESGFKKSEIREMAREWGLSIWNKPSLPCLATRLAYGTPVTTDILEKIRLAEMIVAEYCPRSCNLRVRVHGTLARIEVDKEHLCILTQKEKASEIEMRLKKLGFLFVTIDLAGFKSGSMNAQIKE